MTALKHRADIDGLRAVAVLSVLAFHLGFYRVPGGFLGVDVFFVISGYLIASQIRDDLERGDFSIGRFYARRVRRIAPALIAVLLVTTVAALFILLPFSLERYGVSLAATLASVSNIYFWATLGYFDDASATTPLLHTWSLAVEEQFYVVFPLLALVLFRTWRTRVMWLLAALAILSFALDMVAAGDEPSAAFYLPQNRAWELLIGAAAAFGRAKGPSGKWSANALAAAGAGLIAWALLTEHAHPAYGSAPAAFGALAVIIAGAGRATAVSWLLSTRPAVFIGLISYSLYLWHWPIIAFVRELTVTAKLTGVQQVAIALASVVLATLSWKFVEQPFRNRATPIRAVFVATGAGAAVMAASAFAFAAMNGLPARFPPDVIRLASVLDYQQKGPMREGVCFITSRDEVSDFDAKACLTPSADKPNVLLVGDSHAAHLWLGLHEAMPRANLMQVTASGCHSGPHLIEGADLKCQQVAGFAFNEFIPRRKLDLLILSARWTDADLGSLESTLSWLRDHKVPTLLVGPINRYDVALPYLLARAEEFDRAGLAQAHLDPAVPLIDAHVRSLAATYGASYASAYDIMCPGGDCIEMSKGQPVQFDYAHLTAAGSRVFAQRLLALGLISASGPASRQPPVAVHPRPADDQG